MDKAALDFDPRRFLQADSFSIGPATIGDQNFFRFQLLCGFTVGRETYGDAIFRLFNFFNFGINEAVNAFLLE